MKNYLILMRSNSSFSDSMTKEEKFDYYKTWANYLSQFRTDEKFISGSPLNKNAFAFSSIGLTDYEQENGILEGYMIIQAENIEELQFRFLGNPVSSNINPSIQIHEFDSKAIIGA